MKFFSLMSAAALAVVLFVSQDASAVNCNASGDRCQVSSEWDDTSGITTCLDVSSADTNCTPTVLYCDYGNCAYNYNYNSQCVAAIRCVSRGDTQSAGKSIAPSGDDRAVCGESGVYCGWRNQVNKSNGGSSNASRAKLHSCATNGHADEQYYSTSNSTCQGYASDSSINAYCDSTVWSSLCSNAGF